MVPALIWTIILPIPIIITHILFVVAHVNRFVELQQMLEDKNLVRKKRVVLEQERDYIPVAITVMSIAYILVAGKWQIDTNHKTLNSIKSFLFLLFSPLCVFLACSVCFVQSVQESFTWYHEFKIRHWILTWSICDLIGNVQK